jgi:hypothetical protein
MKMRSRRVRAIVRKELQEYRRSRSVVLTMAILPPIFLIQPLVAVYAFFIVCVELLADPGVGSALIRGPDILAQLIFTPLIAAWSIWLAIAISARSSDIRVAQQLSILASLPSVAVATLIAFDVIHATRGLGLGLAAALLLANRLGWRLVSASFDRERLMTSTK